MPPALAYCLAGFGLLLGITSLVIRNLDLEWRRLCLLGCAAFLGWGALCWQDQATKPERTIAQLLVIACIVSSLIVMRVMRRSPNQ